MKITLRKVLIAVIVADIVLIACAVFLKINHYSVPFSRDLYLISAIGIGLLISLCAVVMVRFLLNLK